jgi:hypothetical protein
MSAYKVAFLAFGSYGEALGDTLLESCPKLNEMLRVNNNPVSSFLFIKARTQLVLTKFKI